MTTNSNVRDKVLNKLNIKQPALSYRAKKIKEAYGPMTTEEAVYVIAHILEIDLSKYLPIAILDRIRSLVPRELPIKPSTQLQAGPVYPSKSKQKKPKPYPLVKTVLAKIGENLGSSVYPQLFIIENSIRELISMRLSIKGANWWDLYVPGEVRRNVNRTITKEKRFPYRESRGDHPLSYSNFSDLKEIILNNPNDFQDVILDFEWFKVKMDEIYMVRNNIAHCVPLTRDDISRINLFLRDWARLLDTAGLK